MKRLGNMNLQLNIAPFLISLDMRALGRNNTRTGGQTQTNGPRSGSASGCLKNLAMMCAYVPLMLLYSTYLVMVEIPVAIVWYLLRLCVGPRMNEVGDFESCDKKGGMETSDGRSGSTNRPLAEEAIVREDATDAL